jgi:hypothetical protein
MVPAIGEVNLPALCDLGNHLATLLIERARHPLKKGLLSAAKSEQCFSFLGTS